MKLNLNVSLLRDKIDRQLSALVLPKVKPNKLPVGYAPISGKKEPQINLRI